MKWLDALEKYGHLVPSTAETFRVRLSKEGEAMFGYKRSGIGWAPCDTRLGDSFRVIWDGTVSPFTIRREFIKVVKR